MQLLIIPLLILSAVIHEFMHGFVAFKLGDPTAKLSGRLTLNPIAHLDPIGSLLLPLALVLIGSPILFAYAKPVPINPLYFKNRSKGTLLTALAGPLSNVAVALVFLTFFKIFLLAGGSADSFSGAIFLGAILVNIVLAVFNLIPIPPLDGSKVLFNLIRGGEIALARLEQYGFLLLILFLYLLGGVIDELVGWALLFFFNLFGLSGPSSLL